MDNRFQEIVDTFTDHVKEFKEIYNKRLDGLEGELRAEQKRSDEMEKAQNRMSLSGGAAQNAGGLNPRDVNKALHSWMKTGNEAVFENFLPQIKNAMSIDSDPDGGYFVGAVISEVVQQSLRDYVPLRDIARIVTIERGDSYEEVWDNRETMASGWVGENTSRPETDTPKLNVIATPLREIYSNPSLTQRLVDDAQFNVQSWLERRVSDEFADQENTAFVTGDGVLRPRGFLSYDISAIADATRPFGEIQYIASGVSAGFGSPDPADEIRDLVLSLKTRYRRNARFLMNRTVAGEISKFKDSSGRYLWEPGLTEGEPSRLLGFPVTLMDEMPNIAADSLSVAFGDFRRGYLIVDRTGIRVLRDPLTSKGKIFFYTTKRVGGSLADSSAIKLLKFATS